MDSGPTLTPVKRPGGILRRALGNAGLLLGGKAGGALMQLAALALAAHGLGVVEFGYFSMLLALVQLLAGLAAFQSSSATVRYGVHHVESGNVGAFQSLIKAGTLLDVSAAAAATLATIVLAPAIGRHLAWEPRIVTAAQWIAPLAFANAIATSRGMLRLFGRFDLLARQLLVTPAARLAGIAVAFAAGASLPGYLMAWLVAGLLGAAVGAWFAWREAGRRDLLAGISGSLKGLSRENEGIWKFMMITNLNSSVGLIPGHLSTFLVGAMLGPAEAGLFKVAREVGAALARPVDLLNQSVYPDIARLVVSREWARLKRTIFRAGLIATVVSGAATLLMLAVGHLLIAAVFGAEFLPGLPVLILISVATTLSVSVFAAEPMMNALGRPGGPLITSLIANLAFLALLLWRLPRDGLIGAGWAYVAAAAITTVLSCALGWATWKAARS